jgi:hypothetical protein
MISPRRRGSVLLKCACYRLLAQSARRRPALVFKPWLCRCSKHSSQSSSPFGRGHSYVGCLVVKRIEAVCYNFISLSVKWHSILMSQGYYFRNWSHCACFTAVKSVKFLAHWSDTYFHIKIASKVQYYRSWFFLLLIFLCNLMMVATKNWQYGARIRESTAEVLTLGSLNSRI